MKEAELSAVIREGVCFLWTWRLYTLASIPHSHIVLALKASCHACLITGGSRHSEAPPFLAAGAPRTFLSSYLGSCLVKKPPKKTHSGSKCQSHCAACVPPGTPARCGTDRLPLSTESLPVLTSILYFMCFNWVVWSVI